MKQDLVLSGSVELTRAEVTQAINEFLKSRNSFAAKKVVYLTDKDSIKGAVVDVKKVLASDDSIPVFPDQQPKEERNGRVGWRKQNVGLFAFIREVFTEKRKEGIRKMTFDELFNIVKESFPHLSEKNLKVYLYDKRQFKNTKFYSKTSEVTF